MSTLTPEYYLFVSQLVMIYLGIPILIAGIIGGIFNLTVFLSLKTFRENACAFYLTLMSAVNIGQLITGLFSRIMINGFGIDWTLSSVFYCKIRIYCFQFCAATSFVCMCLASINQFLATCFNPRWHQWSNIKVAHRVIVVFIVIWFLHGIPFAIYYNHIQATITNDLACASTSMTLQQYYNIGFTLVLIGFLPIAVNAIFALLAYQNVQKLDHRALPAIQRELDKQLTSIVLIQFMYHTTATIPFLITTILNNNTTLGEDSLAAAKLRIAINLTWCTNYLNYAVPFYMYLCASQRFRRQFVYVFFEIYFNRWRQRMVVVNQVMPKP